MTPSPSLIDEIEDALASKTEENRAAALWHITDLFIGDAKNNYLSGGLGSDTLIGNGGDDRFSAAPSGETGVDSLSGGDGNDFFQMQDRAKDNYSIGAGRRNQVEQDPGVDVAVP